MVRRRDPAMHAFDVSSDASAETSSAAPGTDAGPRRRARVATWWATADRRRRTRAVSLAVAGTLLVAGGATAAFAAVEHAEDDRLRAAPGGVLGLDAAPAEVWRVDVDAVAAVLPDGGLATVQGEELVAHDVADGAERWRVELGEQPRCGPEPRSSSGVEWKLATDLITCLQGAGDDLTVTVLDASGAVVGQRDLPADEYAGDSRTVAPAAHGEIVVADHDSGLPARLDFATADALFDEVVDLDIDLGAVSVRLEDALTGEARVDVPVAEMSELSRNALGCYHLEQDPADGSGPGVSAVAELALPTPIATTTMVVYHGCGVDGGATYEGTSLGTGADGFGQDSLVYGGTERLPYPDGGLVVPAADGSALVTDDGAAIVEAPSAWIAPPWATDGRDSEVVLGVEGGDDVVALDAAGAELWRTEVELPRVLARTSDVVVLAGRDGLWGRHPDLGTELWSIPAPDGVGWWVTSAVTDGSRAALAVQEVAEDSSSTVSLVSVALDTGDRTVTTVEDVQGAFVVAVAGQALLIELQVDPGSDAISVASVVGLGPAEPR